MFIEIIKHTPIWVFVLLFLLIVLGYNQSKTRVIKPKVSLILPVVMISLAIQGILTNFSAPAIAIVSWFVGLGFTLWLLSGAKQVSDENHYCVMENGLVEVAGSWMPMFVIIMIFSMKYALGVSAALQFTIIENVNFIVLVSLLFGALNGLSISRAWQIFTAKSFEFIEQKV